MSERFLVAPALFPARIAGETWGTHSVSLELAGEWYRVEGLSASQAASLEARYGPRLQRNGGACAASLIIFRAPPADFRELDTRGWSYALDFEWSEGTVSMAGMNLMALADLAGARAALWTSVESESEFWGVAENVLRPFLAARLMASGGLLVHSAAVQGWLFPSASGGGKSTIARMGFGAGYPVLSDDLNAVTPRDGGFTILALPFTGEFRQEELSTRPWTLSAIVALERGEKEALRPLTYAETVSLLIRCAPYVNQDAGRHTALLERAAEIAAAIPRRVLTFRKGADVWPILTALP